MDIKTYSKNIYLIELPNKEKYYYNRSSLIRVVAEDTNYYLCSSCNYYSIVGKQDGFIKSNIFFSSSKEDVIGRYLRRTRPIELPRSYQYLFCPSHKIYHTGRTEFDNCLNTLNLEEHKYFVNIFSFDNTLSNGERVHFTLTF